MEACALHHPVARVHGDILAQCLVLAPTWGDTFTEARAGSGIGLG